MKKEQLTKLCFVLVLFAAFLSVFIVSLVNESNLCMGVKVVEKSFLDSYTLGSKFDTDKILFEGKKVPSDEKWERIYISQPDSALDSFESLLGKLASDEYELYFINDGPLKNIRDSVRSNTYLSLAAVKENEYRIIDVVITTLPVLSLDGSFAYINEEKRNVFAGELALFSGSDPATKAFSIK